MPSLLRFLTVVALLAGIVFAGMSALAYLVKPQVREMSVTVSQDRFAKQR